MENQASAAFPYIQVAMVLVANVLIGFFLWMVRIQINRIEGKVQDVLTKRDCRSCHTEIETERDKQWEMINHHGHRGLEGEGNQVVRT